MPNVQLSMPVLQKNKPQSPFAQLSKISFTFSGARASKVAGQSNGQQKFSKQLHASTHGHTSYWPAYLRRLYAANYFGTL